MTRSRRALALPAVLAFLAAGTGLPMCASLVARAVQPCAMHEHGSGAHAAHSAQVVPGDAPDDPCHSGDGDVGCATGGSCPAAGVAAPFAAPPVLTATDLSRDVPRVIDRTYRSFLSPPLPPPPQG